MIGHRCMAAALAGVAAFSLSVGALAQGASRPAGRASASAPSHPAVPAADSVRRQRLIASGEGRLAAGDADGARRDFDEAASSAHLPEIEVGLVRAYMQAGEYRRALSFGAHTAGGHVEFPSANALYAWLLLAGGQQGPGRALLARGLAAAPDNAVLKFASEQLQTDQPRALGLLRRAPLRLAPYAWARADAGVAADALSEPSMQRVSATAVLAGDGLHALAPLQAIGPADRVLLRNGMGQTVAARVQRRDDDSGLALLLLASPLPLPDGLSTVPREPFAGSPGAMVEYVDDDAGLAAWPLMRIGFFGRLTMRPGPRSLGIEAPEGRRGGPVFDAAGRLAGIAIRDRDGADRMLEIGTLADRFALPLAPNDGTASAAASTPGAAPRPAAAIGLDAVYEAALRVALQVLADR